MSYKKAPSIRNKIRKEKHDVPQQLIFLTPKAVENFNKAVQAEMNKTKTGI